MKLKSLVALKITVPGIACVQSVLMAASKVGKGILRIVVDGQQKLETPAIKDLYLWIIPNQKVTILHKISMSPR